MRVFDVYNLRNKRAYVLNDLLLKDVMPETSSLNMILFLLCARPLQFRGTFTYMETHRGVSTRECYLLIYSTSLRTLFLSPLEIHVEETPKTTTNKTT